MFHVEQSPAERAAHAAVDNAHAVLLTYLAIYGLGDARTRAAANRYHQACRDRAAFYGRDRWVAEPGYSDSGDSQP